MSQHAERASPTLLDRTRELLSASQNSYNAVFLATGLTPHWLCMLATGRIKDPSVNKIQKLYEHLSGQKLAV